MQQQITLPDERKLTITYRVEDGCLGPEGKKHIADYCNYAQANIKPVQTHCIKYRFIPRDDKNSLEIQFNIGNKILPREKAEKYLDAFSLNLDHIETQLLNKITDLIEVYLGRK